MNRVYQFKSEEKAAEILDRLESSDENLIIEQPADADESAEKFKKLILSGRARLADR